ncbi:hypothetical protein L1887_36604 [Cichorium endivia]|nr:hypothetical protein L1887_36604 [Cichorium endivia]
MNGFSWSEIDLAEPEEQNVYGPDVLGRLKHWEKDHSQIDYASRMAFAKASFSAWMRASLTALALAATSSSTLALALIS